MSGDEKPFEPFGSNPWVWHGGFMKSHTFAKDEKSVDKNFDKDWTVPYEKGRTSADYYFNSYEHHQIHEDMLKDNVRTGAYYHAIVKEPSKFKDKIVIDVGGGTGILSLFAAKAGAKKVITIECSRIIEMSRIIAKDNNYDHIIEFVHAKSEEAEDLIDAIGVSLGFQKGEKFADIIISEWMGYFLLYESMMDSVIDIRDRFLKEEGTVYPDRATLNIALLEDRKYKDDSLHFWENVYGFDYTAMQKFLYEEPVVDNVDDNSICSDICTILDLNLRTCSKADLDFSAAFKLRFERNDICGGLVTWFDIGFTACHRPIVFSTGPYGSSTHWKQTTFFLKEDLEGKEGDEIVGALACRKNATNPRDLDIKVKVNHDTRTEKKEYIQYYRIC